MKKSRIFFLFPFLLLLFAVSSQTISAQVKPKLGRGTFTGTVTSIDKSGNRVTYFSVDSKKYQLILDASSAAIAGGSLSKGTRVRVSYKNLENSEMDIGTVFSGVAVRVVILKK